MERQNESDEASSCRSRMDPWKLLASLWVISVISLFLSMILSKSGLLNKFLTTERARNAWFETSCNILNAICTLMFLYQHPKRFHHLVLLCRWNSKDRSALRQVYCKDSTPRPNEWAHMMFVVLLLHLGCFTQYALACFQWSLREDERPVPVIVACIFLNIGSGVGSDVYLKKSPLGKDYDSNLEGEDIESPEGSSNPKVSPVACQNVVHEPAWRGGLFDLKEDIRVASLSVFCTCCVFGWNMDKLGLGNRFVHTATFVLACTAPFWVFIWAGINLHQIIREALGIVGIVLCVLGLLYGGYWRIQMRRKFNLPENNCVVDFFQWLFCCWCSLAQEVRTANFYEVVGDNFCEKKPADGSDEFLLSPLPHEDSKDPNRKISGLEQQELGSEHAKHHMMPPNPQHIQTKEKDQENIVVCNQMQS